MLFIGDDWAEDHHNVELMDTSDRRLAKARLPEGVASMARLHAMIAEHLDQDPDPGADQVLIGIETDRGPWVQELIAAGYRVFAINPLQASRYRERHAVSGAKSDAADAHVLADMVRTDSHQLRTVAGDSARAAAVKVVPRAHKTLIWGRTWHAQRLRYALREYFPATLEAFDDLSVADTLELLTRAPDPASAAKLSITQITATLKRARHRNLTGNATAIQTALQAEHLGQPEVVTAAYAATVRAAAAVLAVLSEQITSLEEQVEACFSEHPAAEIILSQPGLRPIAGARVLAEFGDDLTRYASAKARKNYTGTSPITRASSKKRVVLARYVHNDRLLDALGVQAFSALRSSPGARSYYDRLRARALDHHWASCRAVARPARSTTRQPPGRTTPSLLRLEIQVPGISFLVKGVVG